MALTLAIIPHGNHLRTYSKCPKKPNELKRPRDRNTQRERKRNGKKKIKQTQK